MSQRTIFKLVIALQLVTTFLFFFIDAYFVDSLPVLLQDYLVWEEEQELTMFDSLFLLISLPIIAMYLAALVGLLFFKAWAKNLYVFSALVMMIVTAFLGPTVEHAVVTAIGSIDSALFGLTVGFLYFSNVAYSQQATMVPVR